MFTGIITDIGTVARRRAARRPAPAIGCGYDMAGVDLGASIACSGVCLTVVDKGEDWFAVDVSPRNPRRTAPRPVAGRRAAQPRARAARRRRAWRPHRHRPCRRHRRGGGVCPEVGDSTRGRRSRGPASRALSRAQGLGHARRRVADRQRGRERSRERRALRVNIIPHTAEQTTLRRARARAQLNIEIDVLARYLGGCWPPHTRL
jgi:riboflavin synthase